MNTRSPYKRKGRKKGFIAPHVREGMQQIENLMAEGWGFTAATRLLEIPYERARGWRKRHEEFDQKIRAFLTTPQHRERIRKHVNPNAPDSLEKKKEKFLMRYGLKRDRNEALIYAGLDAIEIRGFLDPEHKDYDPVFAKHMAEQEQRVLWMIEDNAIRQGLERDGPTQRFILAARMRETYGQQKAPAAGNLNFIFTAERDAEARTLLRDLFHSAVASGAEPRRLPEAPAGAGGNGRPGGAARHQDPG